MAQMTKPEFENLSKEVRGVSDKLIRIETLLEVVGKQLTDGQKKFDDHEARLRTMESWKSKVVSYATLAGSIAGVVVGIIMSLIFKFI
jgi:hypothetical protein